MKKRQQPVSDSVNYLLRELKAKGIALSQEATTATEIAKQLIEKGIIKAFDLNEEHHKRGVMDAVLVRLDEAGVVPLPNLKEIIAISERATQAFLKGVEEIGFDLTPAYLNRELLKELLKVKNVDKYSDDEVKAAITAARKAAKERLSRRSV